MRKLVKSSEPQVLGQNHTTWLAEYLADKGSNLKKYRYRHKEIKASLLAETGSKCIYCESKVGHNTPGDIEHKVPTSKEEKLHFTWGNLTIACTECNRRKNDYYVAGDAFLDPYSDDVDDCLQHLGPLVHWKPGHEKAEIAVRKLELDSMKRKNIFDRKIDLLDKVRSLLGQIETSTGMLKALRIDEVRKLASVDAEYSAMVQQYLKQVVPGL